MSQASLHSISLSVNSLERSSDNYEALLGRQGRSTETGVSFELNNVELKLHSGSSDRASGSASEPTDEGICTFALATDTGALFAIDRGVEQTLNATELGHLLQPGSVRPQQAESISPRAASVSDDLSAVQGLDHLVIQSQDVDATRALYEHHFGLRVLFDREFEQWNMRLCMCRVGDAVLEIAGKLGSNASTGEDNRDHLWGITWKVGDVTEAHSRLVTSGFDVSNVRPGRKPGTSVLTVRDRTHGVPTLLIEHPSATRT